MSPSSDGSSLCLPEQMGVPCVTSIKLAVPCVSSIRLGVTCVSPPSDKSSLFLLHQMGVPCASPIRLGVLCASSIRLEFFTPVLSCLPYCPSICQQYPCWVLSPGIWPYHCPFPLSPPRLCLFLVDGKSRIPGAIKRDRETEEQRDNSADPSHCEMVPTPTPGLGQSGEDSCILSIHKITQSLCSSWVITSDFTFSPDLHHQCPGISRL